VSMTTHKIDLPGDYNILAIFNVSNLNPCINDKYRADLRINLLQQGQDDRGPSQKALTNKGCNQL